MAKTNSSESRARSVVFCGLVVALMTVTAWITIPIGMVPVTLQVFVVIFALLVLSPKQYFMSLVIYIALGAVGLPVFSGMRGGLGVIMGPTGGFLWGFIIAAAVALLIRALYMKSRSHATLNQISHEQAASLKIGSASKKRPFMLSVLEVGSFLLVLYVCGWLQLMFMTGLDPLAAFLTGVAPFVVIDIVKAVCAVTIAEAVMRVLPHVGLAKKTS
ncbi:MAG: biotin transporter BioY [Raoultibacter sp.]|jgi:biotin transport system substrate-specific component